MKKSIRILAVFILIIMMLSMLSLAVFASGEGVEPGDELGGSLSMFGSMTTWLDTFRHKIAPLLAGLSYAYTGFQFISSVFMGSGIGLDRLTTNVKRQMIYTTLSLFFILVLPSIIETFAGIFKPYAWNPWNS